MSFRDVLMDASSSGYKKFALVSQIKGNPSRIEIYDENGEILISMYISVVLLNLKGKIDSDKLKIKSDIPDIGNSLSKILDIEEAPENMYNNILWVKEGKDDNKATLEFYDKEGELTDPKIYVRRFQ